MPTNKDFKRLVRSRMQKTGESYTAARAHLITHPTSRSATPVAVAPLQPSVEPRRYAEVAGMSDAALKKATGCSWERWVKTLDHVKAVEWSHGAIAEYVYEKYQIDGWWAQCVTVGYERICGLRERGQRRDGSFEATRSKTVDAPLGRLFRAWSERRTRIRWLSGVDFVVRKATKDKSMRITWADGTSVEVGFYAKGPKKSQVAVQHTKLKGKADQARLKSYWTERLESLAQVLSSPRPR